MNKLFLIGALTVCIGFTANAQSSNANDKANETNDPQIESKEFAVMIPKYGITYYGDGVIDRNLGDGKTEVTIMGSVKRNNGFVPFGNGWVPVGKPIPGDPSITSGENPITGETETVITCKGSGNCLRKARKQGSA